jgi:hypothetical protein
LLNAERADDNSPFISTYSFPRGHTNEGNIPRIDTLFIDFDFESGDYDGSGNRAAWRRDISHLLVRARRVAEYISRRGSGAWRAALSGHKGIHLFYDFEPVDPSYGSFDQFVAGVNEYAEELVDVLAEETGIGDLDRYVDVTSSDLGRLCRVPNTIHGGASESFGELRYCVPITIDELATISVDEYESLTKSPREVPWESRSPDAETTRVIAKHVEQASASSGSRVSGSVSYDWSNVDEYREAQNENISLSDIPFVTSDRPCVWDFHHRQDKYAHGNQSHYFEMFAIRELMEHDVPIDVMVEFLGNSPDYDPEYSRQRVKEIIAWNPARFRVDSVLQNAPEFTNPDTCGACQSALNND